MEARAAKWSYYTATRDAQDIGGQWVLVTGQVVDKKKRALTLTPSTVFWLGEHRLLLSCHAFAEKDADGCEPEF